MEMSVAQFDRQAVWIAEENIARFQEQLKSETDICQRKLLEGLLVIEREKLRMTSSRPSNSFDATAAKTSGRDQAQRDQDDGLQQGS
jgi:hypothetical protein